MPERKRRGGKSGGAAGNASASRKIVKGARKTAPRRARDHAPDFAQAAESGREALALRRRLVAALDKFKIISPFEFSFAGEAPIDARNVHSASAWGGASPSGEDMLARAIQAIFYDRCYAERDRAGQGGGADPDFAAGLAAANAARERWDRGWVIHQFGPNGQAFVRKGDRERAATPGAYLFEGPPGMAPQIGSQITIRAPKEALDAQPGYYFAFGDTLDELADQLSLTRLYFHVAAAHAARLVGEMTAALNRFQAPFQLKTPASPAHYGRTDALVLYVGQRYFPIVARIVAEVREKVPLESTTPLFTKTLWPGVGAAVEPGNGESFGSHRCRLTAEGIVDAWRGGAQGSNARIAAIERRFATAGIDLKRPWLGPAVFDPFEPPQAPKLP
jgi:hypothetical protein